MKKSIFIVDDRLLERNRLKAILSEAGFRIAGESINGREAILDLVEMDVLPDIVLLDIDMPFMNGYQAAKIISTTFPDIPVVITSSDEIDDVLSTRCGAAGVISKNISAAEYIYSFARIAGAILFSAGESSAPMHIYM